MIWNHPNPDEFFWRWVDQRYPSQKEIIELWGIPQLINISYNFCTLDNGEGKNIA